MNEMDKLREDISRIIWTKYGYGNLELTRQILLLTPLKTLLKIWEQSRYDTDRIVVLDEDQSLPKPNKEEQDTLWEALSLYAKDEELTWLFDNAFEYVKATQQDMLKANFHKMLPREEKR